MSLTEIGNLIGLILQNKSEEIEISLDEQGWANVDDLIKSVSKIKSLDMKMLEEIVATDPKQRYSFNNDKTFIRVNQGQLIQGDVALKEVKPPMYLYYGADERDAEFIEEQGLMPEPELYVQLLEDYRAALNVGKRYGKPVVYRVWTERMARKKFKFYKSENDIWLTKNVMKEYLEKTTFDSNVLEGKIEEIKEVLICKCIEKFHEFTDGVKDNIFWGKVPKFLIIEFKDSVRRTEHHYLLSYNTSWEYYPGRPIMERDEPKEKENPRSGMYYEHAYATFYYDAIRGKAFIGLSLGGLYGRGFEYDIVCEDGKFSLIRETPTWMS